MGETDGRVIFWIMSMSNANLPQENSNEGIFLSASKWEVSDNEARMGELLFHRCTKILSNLFLFILSSFSAKLDGTTEKVKSKLAQHTSIEVFNVVSNFSALLFCWHYLPCCQFLGLAGIGRGLQQTRRNWEEEGEKVLLYAAFGDWAHEVILFVKLVGPVGRYWGKEVTSKAWENGVRLAQQKEWPHLNMNNILNFSYLQICCGRTQLG